MELLRQFGFKKIEMVDPQYDETNIKKKIPINKLVVELSYFKDMKNFNFQLGLGSILSGSVNKHEQSGVDVLSDANSKTLINGSTTYGSIGYKVFGLNIILGYRIWDYYAQHKGTNITRGVGYFNYSEVFAGIGF